MKATRRCAARPPARPRRGIVGVNLGANRDSGRPRRRLRRGGDAFADVADYLTINVSSPNTPGLRDLQESGAGRRCWRGGRCARAAAAARPVLVKIAPDLDDDGARGDRRDGDGRPASRAHRCQHHARAATAISGSPMRPSPAACPARRSSRPRPRAGAARQLTGRQELVLVGVGGVDSAETAFAKIAAGADLVQLYTGLIYQRAPAAARGSSPACPRPRGAQLRLDRRRRRHRDRERWASATSAPRHLDGEGRSAADGSLLGKRQAGAGAASPGE